MKLQFGKHKGCDTADCNIETSYLQWLEQQTWINPALRSELNQELERRSGNRPGMGKVTIPEMRFKTSD